MDYSRITEEMILERYESLPESIQEILNSEEERRIVQAIGKTQYLDQPKMASFETLTGYTLLGFIHPRELAHAISEDVFLNFDHSRSLVDELEKRLFLPVQKQLEQIYSPLPTETGEVSPRSVPSSPHIASGPTVSLNVFPSSSETVPSRSVPVASQKSTSGNAEIKPFILHEEKEIVERAPASGKKGFSLPFQFFRSTVAPTETEKGPSRGEIELPSTQRVVHYNETSTPLPPTPPPVKSSTSFSLVTSPKTDPSVKPLPRSLPGFSRPPQNASVDFSALSPKEKEKPMPRIKGNVVDLR